MVKYDGNKNYRTIEVSKHNKGMYNLMRSLLEVRVKYHQDYKRSPDMFIDTIIDYIQGKHTNEEDNDTIIKLINEADAECIRSGCGQSMYNIPIDNHTPDGVDIVRRKVAQYLDSVTLDAANETGFDLSKLSKRWVK